MRGRAEVARRAHNPKVIGSNPVPATNKTKKATGNCGLFRFVALKRSDKGGSALGDNFHFIDQILCMKRGNAFVKM